MSGSASPSKSVERTALRTGPLPKRALDDYGLGWLAISTSGSAQRPEVLHNPASLAQLHGQARGTAHLLHNGCVVGQDTLVDLQAAAQSNI